MPLFGINIIGYVSSNVSIAVTARHFIRYFLQLGVPVSIYDIDYARADSGRNVEFSDLTVHNPEDLPYSINLFFVALWQIPEILLWPTHGLFNHQRLNAAVIWTEPTYLQPRYREALALFDALISGSDYVQHIFSTQVSGPAVIPHKQPLYVPDSVQASRSVFGLPEDKTLFIQSFDPHNDLERKNPYAAIDAFHAAFPNGDESACLVLKINNVEIKSDLIDPETVIQNLRERSDHDPRILIFAKSLPYIEALRLYASCDVFISLHRAEGLGLGMLECMALGKPVIATAWSGNMSFMNHGNSCLVGYDLAPFSGLGRAGKDNLSKHSTWADPHVDEAADWMKALASDLKLRNRIGDRAKQAFARYQAQASSPDLVEELKALSSEREFIQRRKNDRWNETARLRLEFERYHYSTARRLLKGLHRLYSRTIGWRLR